MEIWFLFGFIFLIIEFITPGLFFALFFSVSSFITFLISLFLINNIWTLTSIFAVISILSLYFLRPVLLKHLKINKTVQPSNIDLFLTKKGTVTSKIEPNKKGRVKVDSEIWLAQSSGENVIEVGTLVKIEKIDGTTLVVTKNEN